MTSASRYDYPHTIDNGAGERITFLRRIPGAAGDRIEGENVTEPGVGPPMHVHHLQAEVFTVELGRLGYQRAGEPEQFAGPGDTVVFAPGEPHRFWNAGDGELRTSAWIEPADNAEYLLTALFESTRRNGGRGPDRFEAAFLMTRYRSEFAVLAIPALVQRMLFPLLVALGRPLGKCRKYAECPSRSVVSAAGNRRREPASRSAPHCVEMPARMDPAAVAVHEDLGASSGRFLRPAGASEHDAIAGVENHHVAVVLEHISGKLERGEGLPAPGEIRHAGQGGRSILPRSATPAERDELIGHDPLERRPVVGEPGSPRRLTQRQDLPLRRRIRLGTVLLGGNRRASGGDHHGQGQSEHAHGGLLVIGRGNCNITWYLPGGVPLRAPLTEERVMPNPVVIFRRVLVGILAGGLTCLAIVLVVFALTGRLEAFERPVMWLVGSVYGMILGGLIVPLLASTILRHVPLWRGALMIGGATWTGAILFTFLRSTVLGAFAGFVAAVTWLAVAPLLRSRAPRVR